MLEASCWSPVQEVRVKTVLKLLPLGLFDQVFPAAHSVEWRQLFRAN